MRMKYTSPRRAIESGIPSALRPLARAYVLGYASSTVPRIVALLLRITSRRETALNASQRYGCDSLLRILQGGLQWQRFPTFCALLVGCSTLLKVPLSTLLLKILPSLNPRANKLLSAWIAAFLAACASMQLLHSKQSEAFLGQGSSANKAEATLAGPRRFAGRTLDLTLFAITRAADVVIGTWWARRRTSRVSNNKWSKRDAFVSMMTDPSIFATSSALIMWSWVYTPERLPRAYNKWISGASGVDSRLLIALRRCRQGDLIYGKDTGEAPLLQAMCKDYGWPLTWGDPVKSIPFPCDIVHMGSGPSCEYHALKRFSQGFLMGMSTYIPLNIVLQIRRPSKNGMVYLHALISSLRSSAFLGGFVCLFYYGVCLARSRLGPSLVGTDVKSCQRIDEGGCIASGCILCGWSILLEIPGRRKDIALFVAPRALATIVPRRYELKYQWRETLAFAVSTATVFTCIQDDPKRVRGVFGKVLAKVLSP